MKALLFILFLMFDALLYIAIVTVIQLPRLRLRRRFARLTPVEGKHRDEIVAALGEPHSTSKAEEGKSWWHWEVKDYHVALLFDGERCERAATIDGD